MFLQFCNNLFRETKINQQEASPTYHNKQIFLGASSRTSLPFSLTMSSLQCHLERQVIASIERSHHTNTGTDDDGTADMHDGGVYVFDVNSTCDGTAIVSSMSDHNIAVYDSNSIGLIRKFQVHTDSITGFDVSKSTPHLIYTGSEDHHICGWDLPRDAQSQTGCDWASLL